jgi:hypothetical protein
MKPLNHFRATTCTLFLLAIAASGIGCGSEDSPMAPQNTGPKMDKVKVTVSSVLVVASCENASDNPGDFTFELYVMDPKKDKAEWLHFTGSFSGLSAQTVDIPDIVFTMDREPKAGDAFTLDFHVTEWDGANIVDDRMNDSQGDANHAWTSGDDWNNGPHAQLVSGSSECRVSFVYSVEVN